MDFGIGYRWRSFESNLLLAIKVPSDDSGRVDATPSAESSRPAPPPRRGGPRPPESIPPRGLLWFSR
jgi:hypothetical protein